MTRAAAERSQTPETIRYYADYPYAQDDAAVERALANNGSQLVRTVVPLDQPALDAKIRAIAAYVSQLSTFWRDYDELVAQVTRFADHCGGEWLWRR